MKNILSLLCIVSFSALLFSSCQKEISFETGNGLDSARGTLKDTLGNCLPSTVYGTYYNGITPGSDTAFVEIQVNVTATGSYSISTDLQNGFQFVDSGFFNAPGINIIRLKPIGTPILPLATTFKVSFFTDTCFFLVDVKDSTGTGLGGNDTTGNGGGGGGDTTQATLGMWKFYDSTNAKQYSGQGVVVDTLMAGVPYLVIQGVVATFDTVLDIQLVIADTALVNVVPGVFQTGIQHSFNFSYVNSSVFTYTADATTVGVMTINLTGYDNVTRVLTGRFSGTANDVVNGSTVSLTNGSFTMAVP
jgi:hypothetical protein